MNRRMAALACVLALSLQACASGGGYQPRDADTGSGYSEQRIGGSQWRVEFVGETFESPAAVERYLLYRAAELTVQSGFDWFTPSTQVERPQDLDDEVTVVAPASPPPASPTWHPTWRRRSAFGWSDWNPPGPPNAWPQTAEPRPYSAVVYITMGRGVAPAGVFDARAVMARLGPEVTPAR